MFIKHLSMVETSTLALIQAPIVLPQSYFISFQSTKVQVSEYHQVIKFINN